MQKYGQHFLINESVINQIVDAALLLRAECLMEIGPGKGALTQRLIERGEKNFTVVEIDPEMVAYLHKHLPPEAGVRVVQENFLKTDLSSLAHKPLTAVSNLPYIDAADILDKVLAFPLFRSAVFMFQKEQAQRILASAGQEGYGPISILTQLRARPRRLLRVGRACFNPPPKVESMVLTFEPLPAVLTPAEYARFARLVRASFAHKRKTSRAGPRVRCACGAGAGNSVGKVFGDIPPAVLKNAFPKTRFVFQNLLPRVKRFYFR